MDVLLKTGEGLGDLGEMKQLLFGGLDRFF